MTACSDLGNEQVMQVALASGFEGPEAFARSFKKSTGQTPSEFRADPQWNAWRSRYEQLNEVRRSHMQAKHRLSEVKIVDFPATKVAALEYRATYGSGTVGMTGSRSPGFTRFGPR